MRARTRSASAVATLALFRGISAQDVWCGKVYTAGVQEVIPGGWLYEPEAASDPLLNVRVAPRHSIYVGSEETADFIVDAGLSYYLGSPYEGSPPTSGLAPREADDGFQFTIEVNGQAVVSNTISVNTTSNTFSFNTTGLTPQFSAYPVVLRGATSSGANYTASTSLYFLPEKTTGSVVKVDNLHGSLLYRNPSTNGTFKPFLPYGFYGNYSGYFNKTDSVSAYAAKGFNVLNPVSDFTDGNMSATFDRTDELNLLFQYDMRGSYRNLTSVAAQVPLVKDRPSLLTYYTADEPDGNEHARNSTKLTYDLLSQLDKYHPTALVLNCQNYYFLEYTAGADIVMEDAYPVGINATWSYRDTPCNTTYGDCGCDNCVGSLLDVPARLDSLREYGTWLGGAKSRKPVWTVPQAFSGEDYWSREPTAEEMWVTDLLAFNHGAKGRLAWLYPPSDVLSEASSRLAQVATVSPVVDFLTGSSPVLVLDGAAGGLDVAYWPMDRKVLVAIANPQNTTVEPVDLVLPADVGNMTVGAVPWGSLNWTLAGATLKASGAFPGLGTSYVVLQ